MLVSVRRSALRLAVVGAGVTALFVSSVGASAATNAPDPSSVRATVQQTAGPSITCSVSPGHYCVKVTYVSVSGGIRVTKTASTGYTTGAGRGREWFRYSCNAGTCYVAPSPVFTYSGADAQLNVTRSFLNGGMFLPCGNRFGVDYINPAVNAPGPRALLFTVVC